VPAPDGEQAGDDPLVPHPAANLIGNGHKASPGRHDLDAVQALFHSNSPRPTGFGFSRKSAE
jgi:hypothetical protein